MEITRCHDRPKPPRPGVRLEALARDRGVRRRADRDGPGRQRLRRRPGRADARARPGRGSRSGSITWSIANGPGSAGRLADAGLRAPARSDTRSACRSSRIPAGSSRGSRSSRRPRARTGRAASRCPRSRSRSSRSPRSRGPTTWAWRSSGYPLGPYRVGRIPGERTTLAVVERRGYLGLRAVPRRPGARGPDEAARRPRRPGGARPLARPAPAVRRRRRGHSTPPRRPSSG